MFINHSELQYCIVKLIFVTLQLSVHFKSEWTIESVHKQSAYLVVEYFCMLKHDGIVYSTIWNVFACSIFVAACYFLHVSVFSEMTDSYDCSLSHLFVWWVIHFNISFSQLDFAVQWFLLVSFVQRKCCCAGRLLGFLGTHVRNYYIQWGSLGLVENMCKFALVFYLLLSKCLQSSFEWSLNRFQIASTLPWNGFEITFNFVLTCCQVALKLLSGVKFVSDSFTLLKKAFKLLSKRFEIWFWIA